MIIFVGDRPSKTMNPWAAAFEGAMSESRLHAWIRILGFKNYLIVNSYSTQDHLKILAYRDANDIFVALGNNASKVLKTLGVPHYKLPHPSGLNRQVNDLEFIVKQLDDCKKYLQDVKVNNN